MAEVKRKKEGFGSRRRTLNALKNLDVGDHWGVASGMFSGFLLLFCGYLYLNPVVCIKEKIHHWE